TAIYLLYIAVAVCVWRERRRLAMWLLVGVAIAGVIELGLTVVNAGVLYRIRFVFLMMLFVLAGRGISSWRNGRREVAPAAWSSKES
ncbi:MAG: hypothetical protein ABR555_15430, partial [Pyrinomonadaceae bacterium]